MLPKIFIYHSVLGIRESEKKLANLMRSLGFEVVIADLYNGKVFEGYEEAMVFFEKIGVPGLIEAAQKDFVGTAGPVIFAGFSNGGALAEVMTLQYTETVGCLLFHAALPISELGAEAWPGHVPVQVHYATEDPWRDEESLQIFLREVQESGSTVDFFDYQHQGHLFTDPTLPDEYNEKESVQLYQHVTQFLERYE